MTVDELMEREPVEVLAFLADAPVEVCLAEGARWTLARVLRRRPPIQTIILVPMSLARAKGFVESATEDHIAALGGAVDARDELAAQRAIEAWWPWLLEEGNAPELLAKSLVHTFAPAL